MSITLLIEAVAGVTVLLAGYYLAWRFVRSRPDDARRLSRLYMTSSRGALIALVAVAAIALLQLRA
jgi:hypothetical protein